MRMSWKEKILMDDIMKEFWLGLFWFSVAYGLFTIVLYALYKSQGWKSMRLAFLWASIGGYVFLGLIGQHSLPLLGGVTAAMVFGVIGFVVIKTNRSARAPYEDRYQKYLQEKVASLEPTAAEWSKAQRALQVSDEYAIHRHDDIERKWREQKLSELDDPFEWRLLYGEHSAERGGDIRAYEKKVKRSIIIGVSAFTVLVTAIILAREIPKLVRYNEAISLMRDGQLEEAQARFVKMDDYRDSMAFYYCCKAQQDADKGFYSSAHFDVYMVKQKYRLPTERYPEGFDEELMAKIDTGYDAYISAQARKTLASMNAGSSSSSRRSKQKKTTYTYPKKQKKSTTVEDDDPLNARSYDNSEDFYDDNYYDFFDYEEAEDYYYEHGGR